MVIDIHKRKPVLANNTGGLSGPAVRPIAVRMTYEVAQAVTIPVIGMGGITCGDDAVQFFLAGATAVMIGTAGLSNPMAWIDSVGQIKNYCDRYNFQSIYDIIGKLQMNN